MASLECSISLEICGVVAEITMATHHNYNAFNREMIQQLTETIHAANAHGSVQLLVLKSALKHYCAGADIHWMRDAQAFTEMENRDDARLLATLFRTMTCHSKPIITIVQGACYGGALGLVACCDIAYAYPDARFCLSEVTLGLVPAIIGPYLVRTMGLRTAQHYMLTAEKFGAEQAVAAGLIHGILEKEKQDESIDALVTRLSRHAPAALYETKRLLQRLTPISEAVETDMVNTIARIRVGAEAQYGLRQFLAKQTPEWSSYD